ncbi:MAG TPA: alpha/beta fold hydrolase, partial [Propionibacteriaceae bacterium]|nr:alpha/beta fold hydrolase [Propionibacteriaceae bacterium]
MVLAVTVSVLAPVPADAAKDPGPAPIPQRYLDQQLDWQRCYFDKFFRAIEPSAPSTLCARITVPMDWLHPNDHPDITLAIAYSRATRSSKGLLTTNPGGPGAVGLDFTAVLALSKLSMFTDYDLLGFDPRGFGDSEAVQCITRQAAEDALPVVDDLRVRNKKAHAVEVAGAKLWGHACSTTEFSQFVSTQQTAYDMEFLRRYLGQGKPNYAKLNYIGYSYGTWLGAWYADTYPDRVGRFILDSNMNWTTSMYANQVTDSFSFQRRRDKMFFPWLARHHKTYRLGSTTAKVTKNY